MYDARVADIPLLHMDIQLLHAMPGRLRVHLEGWEHCAIDQIESRLKGHRGISRARFNPVTANLLIHFDPAQLDQDGVSALVRGQLLGNPREAAALTLLQAAGDSGMPALGMAGARPPLQVVRPGNLDSSFVPGSAVARSGRRMSTLRRSMLILMDAFGVQMISGIIELLLPDIRLLRLFVRIALELGLQRPLTARVAPMHTRRSGTCQPLEAVVSCITLLAL
jgi:hypothetical protein